MFVEVKLLVIYQYFLKCKQNSPLKIKFDIESDERIKLLNEQINYFHSILPKVKKNFNKIQKRINANSEKISKLNKPFYDLEEGYVSEIKKIYTEIDKLRHIDRNNLLEDVAELINIKEPKYTTYAYLEPEVFIHDNYIHIYNDKQKEVYYYIDKGSENKFLNLYQRLGQILKEVIENKKKIIDKDPHYYDDPNIEFGDETKFLSKYGLGEYSNFKNFEDPKVVEEFENIHYKPLIKEKQKRISILKKVFRLTNGYIYVLSNPVMPGLYKVGWTERSPEERAQELSATGLPEPFKVNYSVKTDLSIDCEKLIHKELKDFRYRSDREFFKTDLKNIKSAISKVINN